MNIKPVTLLLVGLTCVASHAIADDTNSDRPVKTHKQLMRECVSEAKQKDSSASDADLRKKCEEKIKTYNDHPSVPSLDKTPTP